MVGQGTRGCHLLHIRPLTHSERGTGVQQGRLYLGIYCSQRCPSGCCCFYTGRFYLSTCLLSPRGPVCHGSCSSIGKSCACTPEQPESRGELLLLLLLLQLLLRTESLWRRLLSKSHPGQHWRELCGRRTSWATSAPICSLLGARGFCLLGICVSCHLCC